MYPVFLFVLFYQLFIVLKYNIPVPYWDEWEFLLASAFPEELNLQWLFQPHNEHMIVFTRLQHWTSYKLQGWNFRTLLIMNYFMFVGVLYLLFRIGRSIVPKTSPELLLFFLIFLVSARNWENHGWAFQSQFHILMICFLLGLIVLFDESVPTFKAYLLGGFCTLLGTISFSAGIPMFCSQWFLFTVYRLSTTRFLIFKSSGYYVYTLGLLAGVIIYFSSQRDGHRIQKTSPFAYEYWDFFANFVGSGYGVGNQSFSVNIMFVAVTIFPFIAMGILAPSRLVIKNNHLIYLVLLFGFGVTALLISWGRAALGVNAASSSRYFEFAGMFYVITFFGLQIVFENQAKWVRRIINTGFGLLLFITFINDWDYAKSYKWYKSRKSQGLECMKSHEVGSEEVMCPTIYPADISQGMHNARKMELKFMKMVEGK
jgi:hypothetical protein